MIYRQSPFRSIYIVNKPCVVWIADFPHRFFYFVQYHLDLQLLAVLARMAVSPVMNPQEGEPLLDSPLSVGKPQMLNSWATNDNFRRYAAFLASFSIQYNLAVATVCGMIMKSHNDIVLSQNC